MILDKDNIFFSMWEKIKKVFSNKWIKDAKVHDIHKIQVKLKESKEKVSKL
jgi:hypothetical protein